MKRKTRKTRPDALHPGRGDRDSDAGRRFAAEAAYADSIFRSALGDAAGAVAALDRALESLPTYAPAMLSLGSVEYQRRRSARGRRLFLALLDLPDDTPDLCEIIDTAGDDLIQSRAYVDGLDLYRGAADRFPNVAVFHQGVGCCAGHLGLHDEAIAASRVALELESDNQKFVNDLGWSLYQAGRLEEARRVLERAVAMDPTDTLAVENLRVCMSTVAPSRGRPPRARRAGDRRTTAEE